MRIEETAEFQAFDLVQDGDTFAFEYHQHNIGFDREQARQILAALQHIVDTGEVPE
jgi:hypothetical protein